MIDKKMIFNSYISEMNNFVNVKRMIEPCYNLTSKDINECIDDTEEKFKKLKIQNSNLSNNEREELIRKIKSIFQVYQEEGHAILGNDYNHNYKWYEDLLNSNKIDEYYWDRYKIYLIDKHLPEEVINTLENKTLKSLMSYLGNPCDYETSFGIRGLVVGDVQSGKTSNFIGLLTKAADAGYKVIFVLTGTIESLRKQTQIRVEEGFIGFDSTSGMDVGVQRGDKTPKAFTSREKDFTGRDNQNTTDKISDYSFEPMIYVIKKNVSVLKKVYSSLKSKNTRNENERIDYPMLMIDDEADNASINTNKENDNPTEVNKYIRKILSLFTKNSYVGFTATPFANVFINYDSTKDMLNDDLFPKDFIYALNSPSNYCGAEKYFLNENDNVKIINDFNESLFPLKHKIDWDGDKLFNSTYESINDFLIINAIRDLRDFDKNTNRSMLINMSRFTSVQFKIKDIVEEYFNTLKRDLKQCSCYGCEYALTNKSVKALKESFDKDFKNILFNGKVISWNEIFPILYNAIKNIKIIVVNSSKKSEKINYDDKSGTRVIAIGGLALSRGLTLEGLCISYFYRNTSTFDVLMQMGRWFGYRDGYDDLCKIYVTKQSCEYYKEIYKSMKFLRDDIKMMSLQHKKPEEYGIRVKNESDELGITAANKMRNTKTKLVRKSFYGNIFETPYIYRDLKINDQNIDETKELLNNINLSQKDINVIHPYFRNVEKKYIINFLKNIKIHEGNESFDCKQLVKFLDRNDIELKKFDVLIMGGESSITFEFKKLMISEKIVERKFDLPNDNVIRMNAKKAHLWGRADTKNGLSKEELLTLTQNGGAKDYLIKGRNPILIIYFIEPCNDNSDENFDYKYFEEEVHFKAELFNSKYSYLVGYAIGFPLKDGEKDDGTVYTVNKTVNYFDKDHDDSDGEDGNE